MKFADVLIVIIMILALRLIAIISIYQVVFINQTTSISSKVILFISIICLVISETMSYYLNHKERK